MKAVTLRTVFRARPRVALAHALVAWCFMVYLVVNVGDVLEGFLPHFRFLGGGLIGGLYRLVADLVSVGALVGMAALLVRRFLVRPGELEVGAGGRSSLLHPSARAGIRRDSAIVGAFVLLHVGARFLGQSVHRAETGPEGWEPFASVVGLLWSGWAADSLDVARHAAWWMALGLILAFLPYFPYSKHLHLLFAPLNFLLKPDGRAPGQMAPVSLEAEPFGAARLEELSRPRLMDAYACVQCNRCQEVCPASAAGTALSPSALEVGKRYELNAVGGALAAGKSSPRSLLEFAVSEDGVWACTSCGACAEICPVGNAPLLDLLDIRRNRTMTEGAVPPRGAAALQNIAVLGNPWGGAPSERATWARDLGVRTLREVGQTDVLYWVGCATAYEGRNQEIARSVVRLLQKAGVDFAILGDEERCTGDPARRMGDEALFQKQAQQNLATLSRYSFNRIVTHCSHCFHVLGNEYRELEIPPPASLEAQRGKRSHPQMTQRDTDEEDLGSSYLRPSASCADQLSSASSPRPSAVLCRVPARSVGGLPPRFGAEGDSGGTGSEAGGGIFPHPWNVIHHTQLLRELVREGRLRPTREVGAVVTYHDSCYLGRYNGEYDAPRELLAGLPGVTLKEMPRSREKGFCCGGGGGCAWIDVPADRRIADLRLEEALALRPNPSSPGANGGLSPFIVASACPFCLTMFEGSALKGTSGVRLQDVAELLDEATGSIAGGQRGEGWTRSGRGWGSVPRSSSGA